MEKIIYEGGKMNFLNRVMITLFVILFIGLISILLVKTQNVLVVIIPAFSFLLINWLTRKSIPRYNIYADKIEIRNRYSKRIIETIFLKDISQVRFEDEFSETFDGNPFLQDLVYLYPKIGFKSKFLNKDKLVLPVNNYFDKTKRLTTILQVFQNTGIDLYVITKRKQLLEDLNIRNWNNP